MTITSITAVGYQEVHPLTPEGRMFTAVFLLVSVGAAFYFLAGIAEIMLDGAAVNFSGGEKECAKFIN